MGLFRGQDQAERAARKRAEAERAASRAALAKGGLPVNAQRRLGELRAGGSFTSNLSVGEFAVVTSTGVRPLSQVMGSSVYHVGRQRIPKWRWPRKGLSLELQVRTDAWNRVRRLALGRLEQEASLVGADAVVGVHTTSGDSDWASRSIEFVAMGTAVRVDGIRPGGRPGGRPALTNLSGQDFWKLQATGWRALGVVGGSTVHFAVPSWSSAGGGRANRELPDLSAAMDRARAAALGRMTEEAGELRADGVVGLSLEHQVERVGEEERRTRVDLMITFHTLGTAIAGPAQGGDLAVTPALGLRAPADRGARP